MWGAVVWPARWLWRGVAQAGGGLALEPLKSELSPSPNSETLPGPCELLCWGYRPKRENHQMPLPRLWGRVQEGPGCVLG